MNVAPDPVGAAFSQLLDQTDDEPSRPDISVIRLVGGPESSQVPAR